MAYGSLWWMLGSLTLLRALARNAAPDLVVCDVVLPGESGFEVVKALRAMHPDLRVLYASGFTAEIDRVGADAFLAKPYQPDQLGALVRELLAR